jgi:MoxR-like ATPase
LTYRPHNKYNINRKFNKEQHTIMAKAKQLREGMTVTITAGPLEGHKATVVDPRPIPDGQENQRKILVDIEDVGAEYILPRLVTVGSVPVVSSLPAAHVPTYSGGGAVVMEIPEAEPITDPMDPALDRFRPNANVVREYVSRTMKNGQTDVEFLLTLRDQRDGRGFSPNVALVGETQSGKTMLVQVLAVLAAERDGLPKPYPVFTLSGGSGVTNYDLFGQTTAVILNGVETLVWMEGLVPLACRCGGFLYLDEWNAVLPSQAVALHPVLDDRRQFVNTQRAVPDGHGGFAPEVVQAAASLWVVSTINPGYKGTQTLAEATTNRFRWLPWDYDAGTERKLIKSSTVRLLGEALREARNNRALTVPVGTSALQRLNHDCAVFGVEMALWAFTGLFPPAERARVEAIIEDRSFDQLLQAEYPDPIVTASAPVNDDEEQTGGDLTNGWQF